MPNLIDTTMRFRVLDSWRGIAALTVALFRFEADGMLFHAPLVRNAYLFVDLFFVLSGFVIAHSYMVKLTDTAAFTNFALRRFGRLWPLHFVMFLPFLAIELVRLGLAWKGIEFGSTAPFTGPRAIGTIPVELGFLSTFWLYPETNWNSPSWSIAVEFWVCLAFGAICLSAQKWLVPIAAIFIAVGLSVIAANAPRGMDTTFAFGLFRCFAGFFSGVLVYLLWIKFRENLKISFLGASIAELAVVILVAVFMTSAGHGPYSIAAPAIFAVLIYIFALEKGAISNILLSTPCQVLGELSYSIYMVAQLSALLWKYAVIGFAGLIHLKLASEVTVNGDDFKLFSLGAWWINDLFAIVYLASVVGIAAITFRYIERPSRAWFNSLAERLAPSVGVTTAAVPS